MWDQKDPLQPHQRNMEHALHYVAMEGVQDRRAARAQHTQEEVLIGHGHYVKKFRVL